MVVISLSVAVYGAIRGRRSEPDYKAGPGEIVLQAEEKEGLMEGQEEHAEPPPSYSDDTVAPRT